MLFSEFQKVHAEQIEADLIQALPSTESQLHNAMRYALLAGGKRIRPLLSYAVTQTLEGNPLLARSFATAIEYVHTYSLIHDDLPAMDDDELRRGKPTLHIQYNEATAILAGDALLTQAFQILSSPQLYSFPAAPPEIAIKQIQLLSKAAGLQGMVEGQQRDLNAEGEALSLEALVQLHQHKTGRLIVASLLGGAIATGCSDSGITTALTEFGEALGLAFQVQDDILDATSTTQILGKTAGSDQQAQKATFPSLIGLTESKEYLAQLHDRAIESLGSLEGDTQILKRFADFVCARTY